MGKWTGDFAAIDDGVYVGLLHVIRWVLEKLYDAIVAVQNIYNELPDFEWWLKLPTGHEIQIVKSDGSIVDQFYQWIPDIKYYAVKWTCLGYNKIKLLPKKNYASFLAAVIAPYDVYVEIDTPYIRYEDEEEVQWGVISDTINAVKIMAVVVYLAKGLKELGLFRIAKKFLAMIFGILKKRRLYGMIEDIEDAVDDLRAVLDEYIANEDIDDTTTHEALDRIKDQIGLRLRF